MTVVISKHSYFFLLNKEGRKFKKERTGSSLISAYEISERHHNIKGYRGKDLNREIVLTLCEHPPLIGIFIAAELLCVPASFPVVLRARRL